MIAIVKYTLFNSFVFFVLAKLQCGCILALSCSTMPLSCKGSGGGTRQSFASKWYKVVCNLVVLKYIMNDHGSGFTKQTTWVDDVISNSIIEIENEICGLKNLPSKRQNNHIISLLILNDRGMALVVDVQFISGSITIQLNHKNSI